MKTCFKCQQPKPLGAYYSHPRMADGHLNKCKECTKRDSADRVARKLATDLTWVLAERERCRLKATLTRKPVPLQQRRETIRGYCLRYPEKVAANIAVNNAVRSGRLLRQPCEKCGAKAQAHHDDYMKPLEVRWLCPRHHGEHHRQQRDAAIVAQFQTAQ